MAGPYLSVFRSLPPPPYGFAYLMNGPRFLTNEDTGAFLIAPYFPTFYDGLTDEDGNTLGDEFGADFIAEQD